MDGEKNRVRILLVNGDRNTLMASTRELSRRGYQVVGVRNTEAVSRLLPFKHFDLAVIDLCSGEFDCKSLSRKLQQRPTPIPIIAISEPGSIREALFGASTAVFAYLSSPCNFDLLEQMIRKALSRHFSPPDSGSGNQGLERVKVLAIDEDPSMMQTIAERSSSEEIELSWAPQVSDALKAVGTKIFDLILLDADLPGVTTLHMLRMLYRFQPTAKIVVIARKPSMGAAVSCLNEGALGYVPYRLDADFLLNDIRRVKNGASAFSESRGGRPIVSKINWLYAHGIADRRTTGEVN